MPMYNLIEYCNNFSKTSGSLWEYYRDEPAFTDAGSFGNFPVNSTLLKFTQNVTSQTCNMCNDGTRDVKLMLTLKCLISFGERFNCL